MKLANRIGRIKPSPTLAVTAKAAALSAEGKNVLSFGAGEPDFDTPEHIKLAAVEAIQEGFTKYTPVDGIAELKKAIIEKLKRDNQLSYEMSQIAVSCGAKHTIYNLAQALFESGDEVIIPAPYWVSYPDIVLLADAEPVILKTEEKDHFKIMPDALERTITGKTKAIILNSPSNPTGSAYTEEELRALASVLKRYDITILSDDIYEKITYDDFRFFNIVTADAEMKSRTVIVNGVSKSHAMTGWRIGYAAGPKEIIAAVAKIQSQNTSNPTSISQKAAVAALEGDQNATEKMVIEFKKRRNYMVKKLNQMPGIHCATPEGAFYVFPNVSGLYGKSRKEHAISDSNSFAGYLLDEAGIAVVPGIAFGDDSYVRLSYATSMSKIEEGLERMFKAVEKLA
ncbi:MAG: pyridoxal phosphate-dependent aminotransferase [Syntrophales bacterium]|jgi:aspartate aminotransferase|nr:pyridoxal phosphate-dependent aminotransferase [Syntrophales bacterium]MDY0043782.1 pyridoxal phosphate-dependent aminotransferase [Syntrophales bacterium]